MKTISIAMATYNGERYIREQLDSILAQTIPFDELIICDDASTDTTWDILSEYAANDTRIKIYRNEQNLGFLRNFEKALTLCTGDYIALSDQDDIWLPEHLEMLLNGISDKMLVVGDAEIIDSNGRKVNKKLSYCECLDFVPYDDLSKAYFIFFYRNPYQGASMMFRKDMLAKALPLPLSVRYHDVWFSALSCFYGGFNVLEDSVTLYRRHNTAVTGKKIRRTRIRAFASHLLRKQALENRVLLANIVLNRLADSLSPEHLNFLNAADRYYKRRNTFWGRVQNVFFELKHFKLIYGIK